MAETPEVLEHPIWQVVVTRVGRGQKLHLNPLWEGGRMMRFPLCGQTRLTSGVWRTYDWTLKAALESPYLCEKCRAYHERHPGKLIPAHDEEA